MKRLWIGVVLGVVWAHITAGAEPFDSLGTAGAQGGAGGLYACVGCLWRPRDHASGSAGRQGIFRISSDAAGGVDH